MTELPTTFGKYYLTEKLATGGMAEIFLGKLIGPGGFEKQLVIKQIHPALSGQRHFVDLFVAEAKILVGLAHGNIVPLYELGVIDDTYFIAMEYIDGPTLWRLTEAVIQRGDAVAPPLVLHIGAELAKGLDYAHRKSSGVIHRDLSPRNVMLSRDGEVKLVDFGIAVTFGGGESDSDEGMPTGSFPYMSPEQVARRPLTGQSDLFSLGVLLWEMLVGARLFARATPEETLEAVRTADIPAPSARRPSVPAALDAVVLRCLERDLDKRWRDAGELASALHRALYALPEGAGARDVAAAVARYCPPIVRAPSEPGELADGPATDVGGPSTQVMDASRAKGKRKPTVREATFATNIEFEKVLSRATPLVPLRAIIGDPDEPTTSKAGEPRTEVAPKPKPEPTPKPNPKPEPKPEPEPKPTPKPEPTAPPSIPSEAGGRVEGRRWLALAALAALVALAWFATRGTSSRTSTATDAALAADATSGDGQLILPAITDAAPSDGQLILPAITDAPGAPPPDAPSRPTTDASRPPPAIDAAVPTGTGTLKVGADPWGDVYLDGKRLGRAPNAWDVGAGRYTVEVVFPSDDGEVRRRFDVTITPSGTESVFADFTP